MVTDGPWSVMVLGQADSKTPQRGFSRSLKFPFDLNVVSKLKLCKHSKGSDESHSHGPNHEDPIIAFDTSSSKRVLKCAAAAVPVVL